MNRFDLNGVIKSIGVITLITCGSVISGCGWLSVDNTAGEKTQYVASGQILLTRPAPAPSSAVRTGSLGFLPQAPTKDAYLTINRSSGVISIRQGKSHLGSFQSEKVSIPAGRYTIAHKQRSPLWFAPESYFTMRRLDVPLEGSRDRLLRGALGEYALFLDKDTPIHSGPISSTEVGGIRLPEAALARIYSGINVGAEVRVID